MQVVKIFFQASFFGLMFCSSASVPDGSEVGAVLRALSRALHNTSLLPRKGETNRGIHERHGSTCGQTGLEDFTYHDLRHCAVNNLCVGGNDCFRIMAMSGHKTMSVFKRYNLVTAEELQDMKWEVKKGTMDTYIGHQGRGGMKKGFSYPPNPLCFLGARSESRTRTPLRAVDFESTASTYSAIRAGSAVWLATDEG